MSRYKNRLATTVFLCISSLVTASCTFEEEPELGTNVVTPDFSVEEFVSTLHPLEIDGVTYLRYLDMTFRDANEARTFYYDALVSVQGALTLNGGGALDTVNIESDIRYCVNNSFGSNKAAVVAAMAQATSDWESAANLNFTYDPSRDGSCSSAGTIDIAVVPTSGSFIASAFFPSRGNAEGNLSIVVSQFLSPGLSQAGVMRHELGHILGFRHEHIRRGALGLPIAPNCGESAAGTRNITAYDSSSTMHYPQCNGTGSFSSLALTTLDRQGAASIYGAPR